MAPNSKAMAMAVATAEAGSWSTTARHWSPRSRAMVSALSPGTRQAKEISRAKPASGRQPGVAGRAKGGIGSAMAGPS